MVKLTVTKKKSPVVHFEMPFKDGKRTSSFYSKVFGWQMQNFPDMGDYILATTAESDDKGPKKAGSINGGFFPVGIGGANDTSIVIEVEDIKSVILSIKKEGGKVTDEVKDIPGIGLYVSFMDSEGNRVGLMQPHKH